MKRVSLNRSGAFFVAVLGVQSLTCSSSPGEGQPIDAGASTPAFPGALGWGRNATGGRGGEVRKVTNLNDKGGGTKFELVNNLIYNFGYFGTGFSDNDTLVRVNLINNYHLAGPKTATSRYPIAIRDGVPANAGANLVKDAVDRRIFGDVLGGTGGFVDDPADVGGWPTLAAMTEVPGDRDDDGMADAWETKRFASLTTGPNDDTTGDGYTNLEEYLHHLAP